MFYCKGTSTLAVLLLLYPCTMQKCYIKIKDKLLGWEGLSSLGIRMISTWYHDGGPFWEDSKILVNTVARKWWVHGRFFRWKYEIPSAPGEDVDKHFWSVRLIKPGVIGDRWQVKIHLDVWGWHYFADPIWELCVWDMIVGVGWLEKFKTRLHGECRLG